MALKNAWNALVGKTTSSDIICKEESAIVPVASDMFPVVRLQQNQLSTYKQIPLASLAAVGTAFSQLPESARTIVQSVTKTVATNETLFIGINPNGTPGYLVENEYGTVGNIMQINAQGKHIIADRMRFKSIDGLPINETTTTVMPVDPMLIVVAVALMTIEKNWMASKKVSKKFCIF